MSPEFPQQSPQESGNNSPEQHESVEDLILSKRQELTTASVDQMPGIIAEITELESKREVSTEQVTTPAQETVVPDRSQSDEAAVVERNDVRARLGLPLEKLPSQEGAEDLGALTQEELQAAGTQTREQLDTLRREWSEYAKQVTEQFSVKAEDEFVRMVSTKDSQDAKTRRAIGDIEHSLARD
jgi:hypothetical protein